MTPSGRRGRDAGPTLGRRVSGVGESVHRVLAGDPFEPRDALRRVRRAILLLAGVMVIGTAGYIALEGWSFLDALYMTVITMASVGFEEVRDITNDVSARIWTILVIVAGVGTVAYGISSLVQMLVEGTITGYFRRRRMDQMIDKLSGHYLVCGLGRVGREVAAEFSSSGIPFVVIDEDPDAIGECQDRGYLAVLGNAADDSVLEAAGVSRAGGLVAAVDSDADNVFVVLSARRANPNLHIVARTDSDDSAMKLKMAGANRTISPYAVGGKHLARLAVHPSVVDYLDVVQAGEGGSELRLEELAVPEGSPLANRKIGELTFPGDGGGARVVAIRHSDDTFNLDPSDDDEVVAGDRLILLGGRDQLSRIETSLER